MSMLDHVIYNNSLISWIYAVAIVLTVYFFTGLAKRLVLKRLSVRDSENATEWYDMSMELIGRLHPLFLLAAAVYVGTLHLTLPKTLGEIILKIFFISLLLQIARLGSHAIKFFIDRYRREEIDKNAEAVTTLSSVAFLLRILLWVVLVLVALDNFGVNVTTLIAGLGVGGIAMALAVQNILGDLFASFSIVLDKPFVIGDFIIVGDYLGAVEYIGLKTTRIRSLSGEQLIFSNADLLSSRIRNFKRMHERRVVFSIGVLYQTPAEKIETIPNMIREIIESQNQVRFDRAHFKEYGPYSLNFEVVYWIKNPDYNVYMDIQQEINIALYKHFDEEGIEFAYPTQTLLFSNQRNNDFSHMHDQRHRTQFERIQEEH
jgi:small-conductance mechanosensitive channel